MIFTKKWFKAAGVRALRSIAHGALAAIGSAALLGDVDWRLVCSTALLSGVVSLLNALAGLPEVKE